MYACSAETGVYACSAETGVYACSAETSVYACSAETPGTGVYHLLSGPENHLSVPVMHLILTSKYVYRISNVYTDIYYIGLFYPDWG